jgi:hypothetical protein
MRLGAPFPNASGMVVRAATTQFARMLGVIISHLAYAVIIAGFSEMVSWI